MKHIRPFVDNYVIKNFILLLEELEEFQKLGKLKTQFP